ncbi:ATP-binding protein [Oceanospirillum sediminis]|uniref:Mg-protoporphyrin IX chelatase n=1 Tax=Oceanospirillum sediminis TaxID=2760088 RepID=A0A839IVG5_9GAMM|nr:ATP-binding protein [Oceanospirillum sediminis]MBB1489433.1 ATP-binding protein [Oceanospirillum sediminis]
MSIHFPFAAVAGQDNFKLALLLAAINPGIGGVVVSGPRGCAKSTLVRGLADLLPAQDQLAGTHNQNEDPDQKKDIGHSAEQTDNVPFITLPLGASEERLLGSIDLQKALNQQDVCFHPGLLHQAHGGVLYVDEVNLLPDHLVDQLLDVAASGINRIERDGISHSHPAEFMLIGTMNPDEGELRPQLQDRFGLCVQLDNLYDPLQRVRIVQSREAFDRDAEAFYQHYQAEQQALTAKIIQARQLLADVQCSDDLRLHIAEACCQAQVDGMRADIVWYRAAVAHAALNQRSHVLLNDILATEELVLVHRRKVRSGGSNQNTDSSSGGSSRDLGSDTNQQSKNDSTDQRPSKTNHPFKRPEGSRRPTQSNEWNSEQHSDSGTSDPLNSDSNGTELSDHNGGKSSGQNDTGASEHEGNYGRSSGTAGAGTTPQYQAITSQISFSGLNQIFDNPADKSQARYRTSESSHQLLQPAGKEKGTGGSGSYRVADTSKAQNQSRSVNWFKTLVHNRSKSTFEKLIFQPRRQAKPVLHLVLLDTSASVLSFDGPGFDGAGFDRPGFNGTGFDKAAPETGIAKSGRLAKAKAILLAIAQEAYLKRQQLAVLGFGNETTTVLLPRKRAPKELNQWVEALTAGGGTPLRQAIEDATAYLKQAIQRQPGLHSRCYLLTDGRSTCSLQDLELPGETVLIDTEQSVVKRGRGQELAQQLGAQYLPVAQLEA